MPEGVEKGWFEGYFKEVRGIVNVVYERENN
jgi:hypothetical protein